MHGVRSVTPDIPYKMNMFATPAQIGAPTIWDQVGGQANAGRRREGRRHRQRHLRPLRRVRELHRQPVLQRRRLHGADGVTRRARRRFTNNKVIVARALLPARATRRRRATTRRSRGPARARTARTPAARSGVTRTRRSPTRAAAHDHRHRSDGVPDELPRSSIRRDRPDGFENGNGYVAELVQAFEDAVDDGADVLSNSWGSSHQNTLDWPDPMVQAAESAVDAGVVGVWRRATPAPRPRRATCRPLSDKVIIGRRCHQVGDRRPGDCTGHGPGAGPPSNLTNMDTVGAASFGPAMTGHPRPGVRTSRLRRRRPRRRLTDNLGCSLTGDVSPFVRRLDDAGRSR